jgi:hypothetical protein
MFHKLTSNLVLSLGLLYSKDSLDSGAQTIRLSLAGPVSYVLDGVILAGYFFVSFHPMASVLRHLSSVSGITSFPPLLLPDSGAESESRSSRKSPGMGVIDTCQRSSSPCPPGRLEAK